MKTYHDIATDGGSDVVGQIREQTGRLDTRLASVRYTVAVMSGKGGVGKSSVAVNLAAALALSGRAVGLLDADLNGASIVKMTGARGGEVQFGAAGVEPVEVAPGMKVMAIDLFLPDERAPVVWDAPTQKDAYAWRGLMEAGVLREMLSDTAWGALDYLLIDLPPGTDKLPNLVDVLPRLSGALVVTIPSRVSLTVVGRSVNLAGALLQTPVLGLVENMGSTVCPHCGREEALFPGGGTEQMAAEFGTPLLGRIPFDPCIARAADEGVPFLTEHPDRPAARAFRDLALRVRAGLDDPLSHSNAPNDQTQRGKR